MFYRLRISSSIAGVLYSAGGKEAFSTSEKAAISSFLSETVDVKIEFRNRVNKQRAFVAKLFYSSISELSSCQMKLLELWRKYIQQMKDDMLGDNELLKMLI